jgi:hypothetical protein
MHWFNANVFELLRSQHKNDEETKKIKMREIEKIIKISNKIYDKNVFVFKN